MPPKSNSLSHSKEQDGQKYRRDGILDYMSIAEKSVSDFEGMRDVFMQSLITRSRSACNRVGDGN